MPGQSWAKSQATLNERWRSMQPYVRLDGEGEAYLSVDEIRPESSPRVLKDGALAIRVPKGRASTGWLVVPKPDWTGMEIARFSLPEGSDKPQSPDAFYRAKKTHYERLLSRGLAGGAWFRHQAREARLALGDRAGQLPTTGPARRRDDLAKTYEMFSGGRAISENLQIDQTLEVGQAQGGRVPLEKIAGVTVPGIDWAPLVHGLKLDLDPLARLVPSDQHAVFYPSLRAAMRSREEASGWGLAVFRLADPRAEDSHTEDRYERQLCLSTDVLARLVGPHLIKSIALTGSDTYFPTGTDLAVLFEARDPAVLENILWARITLRAAGDKEARPVSGRAEGAAYRGFRSPDRRICSYLARIDRAVVVTNSLVQLERLAAVRSGREISLASLPEYTFFRNRYRRGEADETAFVMISDATIRRWCGPRWRIMNSRRTRDAAVLAELQAAHLDVIAKGALAAGQVPNEFALACGGQAVVTRSGIGSSTLGTLEFMTPIAEIPLAEVTQAEADAYNHWRDDYQRRWTWRYDPIALRISVREDRLAAEVTVMPISGGTQYQSLMNFTRADVTPHAGDRHEALLHLIAGVSGIPFVLQPSNGPRPIFEAYIDDGPIWQELAKKSDEELQKMYESGMPPLPIVLRLSTTDSPLRSTVESLLFGAEREERWERLEYRGRKYMKLTKPQSLKGTEVLCFASLEDGLILAFDERVLKRAIDREIVRRQAKPEDKPADAGMQPWLGTHLGLQVRRKGWEVLTGALAGREHRRAMQRSDWDNLSVLNEWKRRYPREDPVEVHRRVWHTELVCPSGGRYVWNEKWQTMESSVYGHPGEPKPGVSAPPALIDVEQANFGISFEDRSLRAAFVIDRRPPGKSGGGEKTAEAK